METTQAIQARIAEIGIQFIEWFERGKAEDDKRLASILTAWGARSAKRRPAPWEIN